MDVQHLRTLRELRDRGSVAAVAMALRISPSAVSQQLTALQRGFPVALTEQRGRVRVLTPAGERLADAGTEVFAALVRAERSVTDFLEQQAEPVIVTAFHSAGLAWFPELIGSSAADPLGPEVHCRDEDVSVDDFAGLLGSNDIVIAHRPFESDPWPAARVRAVSVLREPIDLALPRNHQLAGRDSIGIADLAAETWVAAHEGFALEPMLVQALAANSGAPIRISHRVNEFNIVAAIIAQTGAVGLLPRYTGLAQHFRDDVVLRPISGLRLGRHVEALTRPEAHSRLGVRLVIERILRIADETRRTADGAA